MSVISATSIQVIVDLSSIDENQANNFSRITLEYAQVFESDAPQDQLLNSKIIPMLAGKKTYTTNLQNLINGMYYWFRIKCGMSDIDGQPFNQESILVGKLLIIYF